MTGEAYRSTESSGVPRYNSTVLKSWYKDVQKAQGLVTMFLTDCGHQSHGLVT